MSRDDLEPPSGGPGSGRRAPLAGLWGPLLALGAAVAAMFALRPAPAGALPLQPEVGFLAPQTGGAGNAPGVTAGGEAGKGGGRDPHRLGHGGGNDRARNTEHAERRPPSKRIIVGYGFWIFLLSDIVMFSAFFASYAVLADQTAGGPAGRDLFDITNTAIETGCLLVSSLTCGLATIGLQNRNGRWFYSAMAATFVLGVAFVGLEVREFASMAAQGNGPTRSAFLSAFFALVGLHGLHVTAGLLWLLTMVAQVWVIGREADILRRVMCFALFWHALDIIWVALFSTVYLMGVAA